MATEVDFLILCDAAQAAPDGKLYLLGGGLTSIRRPTSTGSTAHPTPPSQFALAAGFLVDWTDTNEPLGIRLAIEDDNNATLVQVQAQVVVGRPPQAPRGMEQRALIALPITMTFPKAGPYHARAAIDTHEAHKIANFYVVDVPTPPLSLPAPPAAGASS